TGSHPTAAAFAAWANRAPHSRLQTPRDDFPVCGAGIEDLPGDRPTAPAPSLLGISPVLGCDRSQRTSGPGGAHHHGQLWHPQNGPHPELVRQTPTIPCALYPDLRILDQLGGTLVRRDYQPADSTRCVP